MFAKCLAASAALATSINAIDIGPIIDNDKDQEVPQNADAEFTQANCDNLTQYDKWKVP